MSLTFRTPAGKSIRIRFAEEAFTELKKIDFDIEDYDEALKLNKTIIQKPASIFGLNREYVQTSLEDTLYPAFYLSTYDKDVTTESIFYKSNFDDDFLKGHIGELDLQLFNNTLFLLSNSAEVREYLRAMWYRIMQIFGFLKENESYSLKELLKSQYKYDDETINEIVENEDKYVASVFEQLIRRYMKHDTSFIAYKYYKELIELPIDKTYYKELVDDFNQFIVECLDREIDNVSDKDKFFDVFDDCYFAKEIYELDGLNKAKLKKVTDKVYKYYYDWIKFNCDNGNYSLAKNKYNCIKDYQRIFTTEQQHELFNFKLEIEKKYDNDPIIKEKKKRQKKHNINETSFNLSIPIVIIWIILGIVCLCTFFKYAWLNITFVVLLMIILTLVIIFDSTKQ